ncbi:S-layer family protein [Roseobacter sp. OBYS 0001]|uniref:beta strand repeat-containing protein n=1 Tax=Roseobacter sp. OBYS 0001 TaxID=882651 RepID=UPI001BC49A82|nr:Ig-like domain-containing protein [Roseobacter sp. OBYS 0001]GIT86743.1 hypothetical protein ROBYS_17590 [Roseobacter sp. OBYS 0001]
MNSPLTPEQLVNSFTVGNQNEARVETLADGSYVIVWVSTGQDGDQDGIFAQRFSAQGERIGAQTLVNETANEIQRDPSIAATDDGGFVIVWESRNQDVPGSFDFGIYGQRFAADGSKAGGEFQVNAVNISVTQFDPEVAGVPGGGFAVAFTDDSGDGSSDGIRVRFYDAAGAPLGDDVQVNSEISGNQGEVSIAAIAPSAGANGLAAGGIVVTWTSPASGTAGDGSSQGVFAQLYEPNGTAIGSEFLVNTTTAGAQQDSAVSGLDSGRFVIVWEDTSAADGSGFGIFGQVYEGDGTAVGSEFQVNVETSSSQYDPEITATSDGGFVVTWTSATSGTAGDGSGDGVFARRFDVDGVAVSGEILLNEEISGSQQRGDVSALANGDFVSVWTSDTSGDAGDGSVQGVFQRIFGDELTFSAPSARPLVEAFSVTRTFSETDVNAAPQRLDVDGAVAFSDADSTNFAGGRIVLSSIGQSLSEDGFSDQDADAQLQLGLDGTGAVAISGTNVSVGGTLIGSISSDGANGTAFVIDLNTAADAAAVEVLLEHLTFGIASDDPRAQTTLELLVEDGDGATSDPVLISVEVTPESDTDGFVGTERQVNTVTVSSQSDSAISALADGGYISVWTSQNQDNSGDNDLGVFAQRYDAAGGAVGPEFQVNTTVTSSQFDADVAGLNDGGWVVVWDDDTITGVRLNRYDASGALIASEVQVETETSSSQFQPQVTGLSNGGYVVTWTSVNSSTAGDGNSNGVFGQLFNAAGARVGGEIAINEQTISAQDTAAVAALSGGRFVVAWEENDVANGDGSSSSLSARIFDSSGSPEGAEFQVNSFVNNAQSVPKVATLDNGDFVVVWRSEGQDSSSGGIYYQRYSDAGVAIGAETRVNDTVIGDQTFPDIIALDTGGFVIGWTDTSVPAPGNGQDVFVQVFDADGTRLDSETRVNTEVLSTQNEIALAALPNGNYVVQWTSETSGTAGDGDSRGVFQQIIGDPAEISQSAAPVLQGLPLIIDIDEDVANVGSQLVLTGGLSLTDADSSDLEGGVVRLSRVVTEPLADRFNAPDDLSQDSVFVAVGGTVTQTGATLRVDGVAVATVSSDGLNGADLVLDLLAGATPDRVQSLLNALSYQTDSDNPRDSRTYSLLIEDGDGGLTQPRSLEIRINPVAEAGAPMPVGPEEQVNSFVADAQDQQEVAALTDGGWVVVWDSNGQDESGEGVFGQRYNSEGARIGGEFQVNTLTSGNQADPVVTGLEDGGWVVVWESGFLDVPESSDLGIISQRYAADGTPVGGETVVNTTVISTQFDPAVATIPTGTPGFANGGYVVVYTSDGGDGSADAVLMQRFATDGTPVGSELVANTTSAGNQGTADVAVLTDGSIAVTYFSGNTAFVRVFNPDGTEAVAETQVGITSSSTSEADIAATADGGFVIAWTDTSGLDGSGQGIAAQRYDASGAPAGDVFIVNDSFSSTQSEANVIGLDDGTFVIAWRNFAGNADASGDAVLAQRYSATGERLDGEFLLNQETFVSSQFSPKLAALPGGNFVATFSSVTSGTSGDGSSNGIFQQIYGNPADFTPGAAPVIQGFSDTAVFDEADINAGLQRLDADATVAFGDADSNDFDGGVLTLAVAQTFDDIEQLNPGDDETQDQLGLVAGDVGNGDVQFSGLNRGDTVTVDGVTVGTITNSGPVFSITLNTNATAEAVEALLGNLAYGNGSDAPVAARRLSVDLTDGDGQSTPTQLIEVTVVPDVDSTLVASVERGVNAHTESNQDNAQVAELTGGGIIVVWQSTNQDNISDFNTGVFGQLYDANGIPSGPEFLVNDVTLSAQSAPSVTATADGGFVVAWQSTNQDNPGDFDQGIIAQRFDANGVEQGSEIVVNTAVALSQFAPSVASFADGGFVATYVSDDGDGSQDAILSQRFDANGVAVGAEITVNTATVTGNQSQPDVATLVDGVGNNDGHVVVFTSFASGAEGDGDRNGVFAQRFDANGAATGAQFQVNTTTNDDQSQPAVIGLDGGGFVVVWTDDLLDGSAGGVFAQRYDVNGVAVGGEFRVNTDRLNSESDADITALSDGGFLVSWTAGSNQDGSSDGVFGQRFDANGDRIDGEIQLNVETSSQQFQSAVTSFNDGFAAVWSSFTSGNSGDGSSYGVSLRTFESAPSANNSPVLEDVERDVQLFADDIVGGAQILDDGIGFSDPDNANFNGGTLEVYYTAGRTASDQLSIATDAAVTISGSTISINGTAIGTIDAAQNGVNGEPLRIDFNAAADAAAVKVIMEHLAYGSTDTALNLQFTNRGIGFTVTDGNGGQTEPDSIFVRIGAGASTATGLTLDDFADPENEATQLDDTPARSEADLFNAPQLIDANIDFDDLAGTSFDGGFLQISEVFNSSANKQISVQNQGTGAGQIGFDGTNVSYEGTAIGTINATSNGVNGATLRVDLNANASEAGIEALAEALTFGITGGLSSTNRLGFDLTIGNQAGNQTGFTRMEQELIRDLVTIDTGLGVESQVNSFTASTQQAPRIAELSDGGYIVVWNSTQQDNPASGNRGIFAQRFNEQGQQVGVEFQVNDIAVGDQIQPRAEGLSNGTFVLLWNDNTGRDGSGQGVFAQVYQNDGTEVGSAFQVNEEFSSTQNQPEAVDLGAGRFMVVWTSTASGTAGDGSSNGVFGRVFDASGAPEGGEFQINSTTAGAQQRAQVTLLDNGDVMVVWEEQGGSDGSSIGVFAQRVDTNGQLVTFDGTLAGADEQQINTTTAGSQSRPDVAALGASATLPNGGFIVVWQSPDASSDGIFGQVYDSNGVAQGAEFQVNTSTISSQADPIVVGTPGGGFTVAWSDSSGVDGSGVGVVAQRFNADGSFDGNAFLVNEEISSTQNQPDLAVLSNGTLAAVWASQTSGTAGDGSGIGVFQALFDQPTPPAGSMAPVLAGVEETVTFEENAANATPQLLNQDGALSLTDMDSADFDGGSILVQRIVGSSLNEEQLRGPGEGIAQDLLGVLDGNGVSVSGTQVSVGGSVIGTIVQDGSGGNPLQIALSSASATPEAVEAIIAQLSYQNLSDNPLELRQVAVQVTDGDGGSTGSQVIDIIVNSEIDSTVLPQGDEEQVNTFVTGSQNDAATSEIYDSSGAQIGYVVVWVSADQDRVQDASSGIFGQRYDLNGDPVGGEFQVNLHTEFAQSDPTVTGLPTGGFVVGWSDNSSAHPAGVPAGEVGVGTFAQVFDEAGVRVGDEFLVNDITASTQDQLDLAAQSDGTIVAVYSDASSADGSGFGVFLRQFDDTGAPLGASVQVNEETSSTQNDASVTILSGGRIVVTWTSFASGTAGDGNANGVFARLFEANGTAVGGEFQVNTATLSNQDSAQVAALADGSFVVVWDDDSGVDGSSTGIQMQRFDANGVAIGGETLVNETTVNAQFDPYIIALDTGGWVVAWSDNGGNDGSGTGVFGQIYAADGSRIDGEFQLNTEFSSTQSEARLVALPNGGFTAVWTSFTSATAGDGNSNGIFQQVFANAGDVQISENPVLVALDASVTLDEADVNASGQLFATAAGLGDADSSDFDGGALTVSMVVNDVIQSQFAAPDDASQDSLGFDTSGIVSIAGSTLSVNGTAIGTITSDGADGAELVVQLNGAATQQLVQDAIRSLTYANSSDDPETSRLVSIQVNDGDGGHVRELVQINITPETDGAVPVGDEVQTNSFTTNNQSDSKVASLADGGYVVVWSSANQDATGDNDLGVFAQRYDASGAPVGGEIQVNTNAAFAQNNPDVVGLSTGGFVVAWEDNSGLIGVDNDEELAMRVFDANGQPVGSEIAVPSTTHFDADAPALAAFDNGDFVLVRNGRDATSPFIDEIYVQRFNDQGGAVGTETVIAPLGSSSAVTPDVAVQSDGTYVVVFTATNVDNPGDNDTGVFMQRYAADNSQIGGPVQVNTTERFSQLAPKIAATEDGGYVVVFESDVADDFGFTTSAGIYAQRFDGFGNRVGEEFLVNEVVDNAQSAPDVVAISGGGFAITYSDNNGTDGSGVGVFLQQYDAQGNRIDGALQVNQEFSSTQNEASIAALPGGNLVVSFTSQTSGTAGDGSSGGIFHRIIGDPADFASGGDPVVEGINREVTYLENTLNGVPQLIDADGAAAVSDADSADFDGGSILVSNLISSAPLINQINAPDDLTQDQLGLRQTTQITIAGTAVSVDGTEVAQIIQNGQDGTPFELRLNANATAEIVELLVENLTYRNISDDPLATRDLRIQVTDGDGGASEPQVVTITITPTPDSAQPVGAEQIVNTTDTGSEDNPEIVTLPGTGGDFIVTWTSFGTDGSREGIFGQRFDVNGNKLARDGTGLASGASDEFQINTTTAQDQASQEIAAFSNGGWVVAWVDDALDGSGSGIVAQVFNPDGTLNGSEFVANDLVSSTQFRPDVAVLSDDTFVITWESANSAGAGDGNGSGIVARHFQADGTPISSQFVVNTETVSTQSDPAVTELNDGGFLVTWQSFSSAGSADGSGFGIFAQRYDASAAPVGAEFQVNTATRSDQTDAEVTVLSDGNVVVTWTDSVADLSGTGIYATIIAADGTPLVDEFRVNDQRLSTQNDPVVAALDNGDFVIAWVDHAGTDGSGQGVFAQQYDSSGARVDSQFQVNTTTSGSQNQPDIAGLPGGGFVITWNGSVLIQIYGNDAPSISPVSANGDEDTAIVLDAAIFEAGFVDPNGNTLEEIRIETFPVNGALALNGVPVIAGQVVSRADLLAGNLIYTGNQDFNGLDSFLWTGSDGIAFSQDPPVAANITVDPVNDAPGLEAGADTSVGEGANLNRTLTLTDPDTDSRSFTVDYGDGSPVATFTTSSLSPVLNHVFAGEGTFTVTVTVDDNAGEVNSVETDTFEVTVVNANPNATNDFVNVSEDGPAVTGNALTNDSDPGGDALTVSAVNGVAANVGQQITLASGALVTLNADGSFDYDPNGQFEDLADFQTATDPLSYEISDGEGGTDTATINFFVRGENDDPDAVDDAFAANDDNPISGNVLNDNGSGADSDVDAVNTLTVSEVNGQAGDVGNQITLASGALLTLNADGTFDYDPNGAFGTGGTDSFDYTLSDGRGGTDTASVTISINGTNPPPTARDDSIAADEEVTVNGDVLADNGNGADSDAGGDPITVTQVNGSAANVGVAVLLAGGGQVTLQSNGQFSFDPNNGYEDLSVGDTATETFEYTIEDGNGGSDTATVTLTIAGVNDAPLGVNDTASTDEDSSTSGNVLSNDTDIDANDTLVVTEVGGSTLAVGVATTTSSGGSVTLGSDGQFIYDPGTAFNTLSVGQTATDSISYTVADGNGGSATATLSIVVNGVNDAPVANDDALAVGEDSTLFGNLTADNGNGADSDPDASDVPFVSAVNGQAADIGQQITLASGALLTVNGSGTFSYDTNGAFDTLNAGETATDSFVYTLSDGNGGTDTATATITINGDADAPVAVDDSAATDEATAVTGDVLANDTDANGDTLLVSAVNGAAGDVGVQVALASGALLTLNSDGTFDYDPNGQFETLSAGQSGTDTFDYTVSDGNGGADTATVTVDISGLNDSPIAQGDFFTTSEDAGLVGVDLFANNGGGVDSDIDQLDMLVVTQVDGQSANVGTQVQLASGALLTVNADGTADYDPNGAFEFLSVGATATDSFTYTISDGNGGTDTATVSIGVSGVNDAPDAVDDSRGVSVDGALSGNVLSDNGNGADSDIDGDTLSVTALNGSTVALGVATTLASGAIVTLNADGTFDYDQNGSFSGLGAGTTATDTFDYTISDGNGGTDTATVTITIGGSNLPPVAIDDAFDTNEDTAFTTGSVLGNDDDPNTDPLSVTGFDDTTTVGIVTNNGDGTFDYNPNGQFETLGVGETAVDTFTYMISDGNGGVDSATVNITINGVNDAPVASDDALAVTEDTSGSVVATANDTDIDGDDVEITSVDDLATIGAVLVEADNDTITYDTNGQFETLAQGETATDSFSYTVTDGNGGTATATVDVTITGVNDGPVAQDDTVTTDEDTGIIGGSVLADNGNGVDSDVDNGAVLSIAAVNGQAGDVGSQVTLASGALLTLNADGTFDYDPNGAFEALALGDVGSDSFTYTLTDEFGATDDATVTVSIDGVNDAPVAQDDSFATDEDTGVSGNILSDNGSGADSDVDAGDTRVVSAINGTAASVGVQITLASGALLTVGADGALDYDPNGAFEFLSVGATATDSFTYTISDGNGGTDTATVSIGVSGVNDAPDAVDDSRGVSVDGALSGNVLIDNGNGADSDIDGDTLSVTALNGTAAALGVATTLASGAIVTLNADGTFDYDQNGSFSGLGAGTTATDTFDYTISDGNGGTDTATVTITISPEGGDVTAGNDAFVVSEGELTAAGRSLFRLAAIDDRTDLLENDTGANKIISVNGAPIKPGILFAGDNGGQFRVFEGGVLDFQNRGDLVAPGDTTGFTYTVSDGNGGTDTATVTLTIGPDIAADDTFDITEGELSAEGRSLFRLGAINDQTDLLENDIGADKIISVNGEPIKPGILFAGDNGGQFRVYEGGVVDFQNRGDFVAAGESTGFTYTVSDGNGGTDTARVTLNVGPDIADDDVFMVSAFDLDDAGRSLFRLGAINDQTDLLENDFGADEIIFVNGEPIEPGILFAGDNGGEFRVYPGGVVDFQNRGDLVDPGDTTGFTYTVSDGNGGTDTARVTLEVGLPVVTELYMYHSSSSMSAVNIVVDFFTIDDLTDPYTEYSSGLTVPNLQHDELVFIDAY